MPSFVTEDAIPGVPGLVTFTVALADFEGSATLVARTLKFPTVLPAVNSPAAEIVPPVAVHVTPVFDEPVTVAANCFFPPAATDAEVGLIETATPGALAVTVTVALADFEGSATLVARTLKLPAVLPAVNSPAAEIVPPVAVHVTPVFDEPVTVAANCFVPPVATDVEVGLIETATPGALAVTVTLALADFVASAMLVAVMV
jgi:hypothetical protein